MKSPPHGRLDGGILSQFLAHCRTREVSAKTMIIKVNDLPDRLFYLIEGSVEVIIEDERGRDMVLAYLNSGHFFGEMGFFNQQQSSRSAWVRARTDCVIGELDYKRFKALAHSNPGLVVEMATQMAIRLQRTDAKLGDLAFLDVTGRVAHVLLRLCDEPDAEVVDDGRRVRVTRPQLARLTGCSREMVCRVLKNLQTDGLIYNHDGGIVVRSQSYAADVA